jgi:MerR family copper efflux transcriptional regulator
VACTLSGDGPRGRVAEWRAVLDGAVHVAIPEGLRLTLPVELAAAIAGLAAFEQQSCAFFCFRLHLDGPRLNLEVRAPEAGTGLLAEMFTRPA